jgi:hypothetical protein
MKEPVLVLRRGALDMGHADCSECDEARGVVPPSGRSQSSRGVAVMATVSNAVPSGWAVGVVVVRDKIVVHTEELCFDSESDADEASRRCIDEVARLIDDWVAGGAFAKQRAPGGAG